MVPVSMHAYVSTRHVHVRGSVCTQVCALAGGDVFGRRRKNGWHASHGRCIDQIALVH